MADNREEEERLARAVEALGDAIGQVVANIGAREAEGSTVRPEKTVVLRPFAFYVHMALREGHEEEDLRALLAQLSLTDQGYMLMQALMPLDEMPECQCENCKARRAAERALVN